MAYCCEKVVLACGYCKITHFTTTVQLEKHWHQDCSKVCVDTCVCKKYCQTWCKTKIQGEACIEYVNQFTFKEETFLSYFKDNRRWLFFSLKDFYVV